MLPAAPESMLASGLGIVREICEMAGDQTKSIRCLGIRRDSIELKIEKSKGIHIIELPDLGVV